jgi:hypothetical protein
MAGTKPKIFISHSCKDLREIGAGERLDQLKYARRVRDEVLDRLRDACEILLDGEGLEPGDPWRAKLHRWLGSCDGALILLDRESIKSKWVLKEATILTWRKSLRNNVLIVPAFLGDLASGDLTSSAFGPLQLSESQPARLADKTLSDANATALAGLIADKFLSFALREQALPDDMSRWIRHVAAQFTREDADSAEMDEARRVLCVTDEDWHYFPDREITFAHQLLHVDLDLAYKALDLLRLRLDKERFGKLVALIRPTWVTAAAAQLLLQRAPGGGTPPAGAEAGMVFALNTKSDKTAHDYIARAHCGQFPMARVLKPPLEVGEGQEAEAIALLRNALVLQLRLDEHEDHLLPLRLKADRFFAVLKPTPEQLPLLPAVCGKFPLGFLVLAGHDFEIAPAEGASVLHVRPAITSDVENNARVAQARLDDLLLSS